MTDQQVQSMIDDAEIVEAEAEGFGMEEYVAFAGADRILSCLRHVKALAEERERLRDLVRRMLPHSKQSASRGCPYHEGWTAQNIVKAAENALKETP
jgi:hypothetical protein